ncbi:MAG: hypothetical protein GF400_10910, partial [Candidatus Eisenbacteria bacterium]|nr:hypothetical protein [Candidatus Eisenbacteria bacterium]
MLARVLAVFLLAAPTVTSAQAVPTERAVDTGQAEHATPTHGDYPDASGLLEDFDDLYRSTGTVAEFEITVEKPDKTRTMEAMSWSKGEEKALIVIESP